MTHAAAALLESGRSLRVVEAEIYSVLPTGGVERPVEIREAWHDRLAGSQILQRLAGNRAPFAHQEFVATALESDRDSWLLDAGCGSLALSSPAYARASARPTILVDKSLTMLRRARRRLRAGGYDRRASPLMLLQADVEDLPFRAGVFGTILCMGMLDLVADPARLFISLDRILSATGGLYVASHVTGIPSGTGNRRLPAATGVPARSPDELATLLERCTARPLMLHAEGGVAFGVAQHEG